MALPGTAGFPGEFLVIMGAWAVNPWVALGAATGMILGACYMLLLYGRVAFGRITRDDLKALLDLSPREYAIFAPLIALTLWMGVYPESFMAPMRQDVAVLLARLDRATPASDSQPTAGRPAATPAHGAPAPEVNGAAGHGTAAEAH